MATGVGGSDGGALSMQSTGAAPAGSVATPAQTNSGISTPGTPSLQSLMTQPQTAGTFAPSNGGTATPIGTTPTAAASLTGTMAAINNGQFNPQDATNSAAQIDAITNANSPYIQQAEQQGLLSAASRGLENSSIGAGSAESAAVAAAAPLAEQNAGEASQGMLQNAQLSTQANEFNASQENANQQLQAQLGTQEQQFNASQTQAAAATNTAAQNAMTQQVMSLDEQISQQYLSGSQAQSLAGIQGQYNELIASNSSASSMFTSMMNGISATMANQNISPGRVADTIQADYSVLSAGLGIINSLNGGTGAKAPAVTSNSAGGSSNFSVTTAPAAAAAPAPAAATKPATTPAKTTTTPAKTTTAPAKAPVAAPAKPAASATTLPVTTNAQGQQVGYDPFGQLPEPAQAASGGYAP
jgi:hypothetical protein